MFDDWRTRFRRVGVTAGLHYIRTGDGPARLAYETSLATCTRGDASLMHAELMDKALDMGIEMDPERVVELADLFEGASHGLFPSMKLKSKLEDVSPEWHRAVSKNDLNLAEHLISKSNPSRGVRDKPLSQGDANKFKKSVDEAPKKLDDKPPSRVVKSAHTQPSLTANVARESSVRTELNQVGLNKKTIIAIFIFIVILIVVAVGYLSNKGDTSYRINDTRPLQDGKLNNPSLEQNKENINHKVTVGEYREVTKSFNGKSNSFSIGDSILIVSKNEGMFQIMIERNGNIIEEMVSESLLIEATK